MNTKDAIGSSDKDGFAIPPRPVQKGGPDYGKLMQSGVNDSAEPLIKKAKNGQQLSSGADQHPEELMNSTELTGPPKRVTSVKEVLEGLRTEADLLNTTWTQAFSESENYELLFPDRLDQMIHEATQLEQNLIRQKNALRERLGFLSTTLKI